MYNYYVVYRINHHTTTGRTLAARKDIDDTREHLEGFRTKSKLVEWLKEYVDGLREYIALKPIEIAKIIIK
jgi:hypothetical protein